MRLLEVLAALVLCQCIALCSGIATHKRKRVYSYIFSHINIIYRPMCVCVCVYMCVCLCVSVSVCVWKTPNLLAAVLEWRVFCTYSCQKREYIESFIFFSLFFIFCIIYNFVCNLFYMWRKSFFLNVTFHAVKSYIYIDR